MPSLKISELEDFSTAHLKVSMPELPHERRERYLGMGIQGEAAELFVRMPALGKYFESVIVSLAKGSQGIKLASNYVANDIVNLTRDTDNRDSEVNPEMLISALNLRKILDMQIDNKISSRTAKDLLLACIQEKGKDPESIAHEKGLFQITDTENIDTVVSQILEKHPSVISDYKAGKSAALEFLVGQGMKALKGAVDPNTLRTLIQKQISK